MSPPRRASSPCSGGETIGSRESPRMPWLFALPTGSETDHVGPRVNPHEPQLALSRRDSPGKEAATGAREESDVPKVSDVLISGRDGKALLRDQIVRPRERRRGCA